MAAHRRDQWQNFGVFFGLRHVRTVSADLTVKHFSLRLVGKFAEEFKCDPSLLSTCCRSIPSESVCGENMWLCAENMQQVVTFKGTGQSKQTSLRRRCCCRSLSWQHNLAWIYNSYKTLTHTDTHNAIRSSVHIHVAPVVLLSLCMCVSITRARLILNYTSAFVEANPNNIQSERREGERGRWGERGGETQRMGLKQKGETAGKQSNKVEIK